MKVDPDTREPFAADGTGSDVSGAEGSIIICTADAKEKSGPEVRERRRRAWRSGCVVAEPNGPAERWPAAARRNARELLPPLLTLSELRLCRVPRLIFAKPRGDVEPTRGCRPPAPSSITASSSTAFSSSSSSLPPLPAPRTEWNIGVAGAVDRVEVGDVPTDVLDESLKTRGSGASSGVFGVKNISGAGPGRVTTSPSGVMRCCCCCCCPEALPGSAAITCVTAMSRKSEYAACPCPAYSGGGASTTARFAGGEVGAAAAATDVALVRPSGMAL